MVGFESEPASLYGQAGPSLFDDRGGAWKPV